MMVTCKCEKEVCIVCRQPETHGCGHDYVAEQKEKLEKENPALRAEKLAKV